MPIPVLLLHAAWLRVETIQRGPWCAGQEAGMGSYDPQRSEIALCTERIRSKGSSIDEVARHELFHAVQHLFGRDGRSFLSDS